jgi:hypothetical protein
LSATGAFVPGTLLAGRYRTVASLLSSVLLINHVSLPLEPLALERQARQMLHALGYTTPPVDAVSEWRRLDAYRVIFGYLESPEPLDQAAGQNAFSLGWASCPSRCSTGSACSRSGDSRTS